MKDQRSKKRRRSDQSQERKKTSSIRDLWRTVKLSALDLPVTPVQLVRYLSSSRSRGPGVPLGSIVIGKKDKANKRLRLTSKGLPMVRLCKIDRDWQLLGSVVKTQRYSIRRKNKFEETKKRILHFKLPSMPLYTIGQYLFKEIIESGTIPGGLLYEAGLHIPSKPALSFVRHCPSTCDIRKLSEIAHDLKSCDKHDKPCLPDFNELLFKARAYRKQHGVTPILVVDVELGSLQGPFKDKVFISAAGTFHLDDVHFHVKYSRVLAYAPVVEEFDTQQTKFVIDDQFFFTNRALPTHYVPTVAGKALADHQLGEPFDVRFDKASATIEISINLYPKTTEASHPLVFKVWKREIPNYDLTWSPIRIVDDTGPDIGKSAGVTAHVLRSFVHQTTGPEIQRPLIFLGGFDEGVSTSYPHFYNQIASISSGDFITTLRQKFDVILLTYDDVSVSLELNARALVFTLRDIIERTSGNDPLVLLSISMGGLVARLALCGIESGTFGQDDPVLGRGITDHHVKVWVTIDTPHQGAHIPLGLQYLVHGLRYLPMEEIQKVVRLLSCTSAKEMLIDHFEYAPVMHPKRVAFLQKLQDWGGFPQSIDTTIAVSCGALECIRMDQAYWAKGYDCSSTPWPQGCIRTFDRWDPIIDNILAARENPDLSFNPQSNRGGLHGLRILDLYVDLGADWGFPIFFDISINARAVEFEGYWYLCNSSQSLSTRVFRKIFTIDVIPDGLEWLIGLEDPTLANGENMPPGVCYEVFAGGWLLTAETIFSAVIEQFESAREGMDSNGHITYPRLWMPRHCFVPTVSALDLSEEFLRAKYRSLLLWNNFECTSGTNLFPYTAIIRGDFSYEDFVDIAPLMWLSWFPVTTVRPIPSPGNPLSFSGEIQENSFPVWIQDSETGQLTQVPVEGTSNPILYQKQKLRATNFDWVYFHEENRQHGNINAGALQFVMDKIDRTLRGELPSQPAAPGPGPLGPRIKVSYLKCTVCNYIQPCPPICPQCGHRMSSNAARDGFECTCGNSITWPILHCGQPMELS